MSKLAGKVAVVTGGGSGVGKAVALPSILPHIGGGSGNSDVHALSFTMNAFALLAAGLLLGATGSAVTLRRFLQV